MVEFVGRITAAEFAAPHGSAHVDDHADDQDHATDRLKKRRSRHEPASPVILTAAESELADRLQSCLARRPRRPEPEAKPQPSVAPEGPAIVNAVAPTDAVSTGAEIVAPFTDVPESKDDPADAADPGSSDTHVIQSQWLKSCRQSRLHENRGRAASWLITVAVIAAILSAAMVGLLGVDKSRELAAQAAHRASQAVTSLQALTPAFAKR